MHFCLVTFPGAWLSFTKGHTIFCEIRPEITREEGRRESEWPRFQKFQANSTAEARSVNGERHFRDAQLAL